MRFHSMTARALAWVFVLFAPLAAPAQVQAQPDDLPIAPVGEVRHHGIGYWLADFHARNVPIPRTYSYYYAPWFNQPRHYKVVGPDGKVCWRTAVRGLPLGTPWPPYPGPALP
jgi:hypothetical protein